MYRKYIKRLLDIIFSIILIVVLSPFFLITAVLTWIDLGRPIIFKQEREGLNKKTYIMYKFRIMDFNYDAPRETRMDKLGKFFDVYKFNELPQLINVLKGDMSLVGPRPFIPGDPLPSKPPKERYLVRPGITGLAQIHGVRQITHKDKLKYDIVYYKKLSFLLDLKIILLTPIMIFKYR